MDWETLNPVTRLKSLLGPLPIHPWSVLIPQLLLWSFRRFCIEKLLDDNTESLMDCIWDDHMELIQKYAPDGLKNVAGTWLIPENLRKMHSSPQEYNVFFTECMTLIDRALQGGDAALEDRISDFLDFELRQLFAEWLGESKKCLLIYPQKEEEDDVFTDAQFMALIQSLLAVGRKPAQAQKPAPVLACPLPPIPESAPEPVATVEPPVFVPLVPCIARDPGVVMAEPAPAEPVAAAPVAVAPVAAAPVAVEPAAFPAPTITIGEAIRRRHTYRRHGRRANRGVTLRSTRARTKTRKVTLAL